VEKLSLAVMLVRGFYDDMATGELAVQLFQLGYFFRDAGFGGGRGSMWRKVTSSGIRMVNAPRLMIRPVIPGRRCCLPMTET